jgi:hypothetical protein
MLSITVMDGGRMSVSEFILQSGIVLEGVISDAISLVN